MGRKSQQLELLADLSARAARSLDLPTVLKEVVDAACRLTGARYGALASFDSSGRLEQFITHGIPEEERELLGDSPAALEILGRVRETREALQADGLFQYLGQAGSPPGPPPPIRTFIGVPISGGDEVFGNLYIAEKEDGLPFTVEDERLLVLFSSQAAIAIHNARLHDHSETQRSHLITLVDTAPAGIFVVGADGDVVIANKEIQRMLGLGADPSPRLAYYERAITYSRPDGTVYEVEDLPLQRALYRGETVRAEEVIFNLDEDRRIPTLVDAAPTFSSDGKIAGAVAIIQDISSLEEVEKLRNEFLGMVTHELKTPLASVKGAVAMLQGSFDALSEEEKRDLLRVADEQSDRMRELIDNLLDMSRIRSGALNVEPVPTDVAGTIRGVVSAIAGAVEHKIEIDVDDGLPLVHADGRRIEQVLTNLISNAVKYSTSNRPITVSARRHDHHVFFTVTDRGRGLSPHDLPLIFRKFSRIEPEAGIPGSGLGLAVCKGIIEAHGGRIWVESEGEGKGAAFSFSLPITAEETDSAPSSQSRTTEALTVLAIDDDPQLARLIRRQLREAGHRAVIAMGPERLSILMAENNPDLVLLDLNFPGISGIDVLRQIKSRYDIPVIVLTASDREEDVVRSFEMGADDYVRKPYSPPELLARINVVMKRHTARGGSGVRNAVTLGDLRIDFSSRQVFISGRQVHLTTTQYKLLVELARNAGRILTHDQLLQRVWGENYEGDAALVRSFVRDIRRKLGDDSKAPSYIFTEPGVGYRMPRAAA